MTVVAAQRVLVVNDGTGDGFSDEQARRISELLNEEASDALANYSASELREALLQVRVKNRSLSAQLLGNSHALDALKQRIEDADQAVLRQNREAWFSEVARRAKNRQRRGTVGSKRFSLLVDLGQRLQDAYAALGDLGEQVERLEKQLQMQSQQGPNRGDGWLGRFRRKDRSPDEEAFDELNEALDEQSERIVHLEGELQKKADAVGDMLQKIQVAQDARRDAISRHKALLKQQERLASAFQEQTKRSNHLKEENKDLSERLSVLQSEMLSPEELERFALLDEQLQATKESLVRARARAEAAEEDKHLAHKARTASLQVFEGTKAQVDDLKRSLKLRDAEVETLEAARNQLEFERDALQRQIGQLGEAHSGLQESAEALENASADDLDLLKGQLLGLQRNLAQAKLDEQALSDQLQASQSQFSGSQRALDYLRDRLAHSEQQAQVSQVLVGELESRNVLMQEALDKAEAAESRGLATREHLQSQLQQCRRELTELEGRAEQSELRCESAESQLELQKESLQASLEAQKEAQTLNHELEGKKASLEQELQSSQGQLKTLQGQWLALESRFSRAQRELSTAESERDESLNIQKGLETELAQALLSRDEALEGQQLAKSAERNAQEELQVQEERLSETIARASGLEVELTGAKEQLHSLGQQVNTLSLDIAKKNEELSQAQQRLAESEAQVLEQGERIESLGTRLAGVREGLRLGEGRLRETEEQLSAAQNDLESYREKESSARQALVDLQANFDALSVKSEALQHSLEQHIEAKAQLAVATERMAEQESEVRDLEQRLQREVERSTEFKYQSEESTANLKAQEARLIELEDSVDEGRQTSLRLRGDLKETRKAIGELTTERDEAIDARELALAKLSRLERSQAQWQEEKDIFTERLAGLKDANVQGDSVGARDAQSWQGQAFEAGQLAGFKKGRAEGLQAGRLGALEEARQTYVAEVRANAFEEGRQAALVAANLSGSVVAEVENLEQNREPEPIQPERLPDLNVEEEISDLPPDGVPRFAQALPTTDDLEELPPVSLGKGSLNSAFARSRVAQVGSSKRFGGDHKKSVSRDDAWERRSAASPPRQKDGSVVEASSAQNSSFGAIEGGDKESWSQLVNRGNYRARMDGLDAEKKEEASPSARPEATAHVSPAPSPSQGNAPRQNWHRPIVDLNEQSSNVRLIAQVVTDSPSEADIEEALAASNFARAQRLARARWRQNPLDQKALTLFFKAAKANSGHWMEALVELDERMPPESTSSEQSAVISGALVAVGQPTEAIPYLLWNLFRSERPSGDSLLDAVVTPVLALRLENRAVLRSGPLMKTLGAMSLGTLSALFFRLQSFELKSPHGPARGMDFFARPPGGARFAGGSLKQGQGLLVRSLGACGPRLDADVYEQLNILHDQEGSGKTRYSYLVLPQGLEATTLKEIRSLRRWKRHYIAPISRDEIIGALSYGTEPDLLKSSLKK